MQQLLRDEKIRRILTPHGEPEQVWQSDLERFKSGKHKVTRQSAGEGAIKAIQRMLVFLGYSTSATGAFAIDGDFGRGTNRAVAQFQFDHRLTKTINSKILCYPCNWQNAKKRITAIPNAELTLRTMNKMLEVAKQSIRSNTVLCGDFNDALYFLNQVDRRQLLNCRSIVQRYKKLVEEACNQIEQEKDRVIRPEWVLTIIKQETGGVVRPRFEQHILSRLYKDNNSADLIELRFQAMSQGLGQVLGSNYALVGAESAQSMFQSPLRDQVLYVARFLTRRSNIATIVKKGMPSENDFHAVAKYYNGRGYKAHHYHEGLARWFKEFRLLVTS